MMSRIRNRRIKVMTELKPCPFCGSKVDIYRRCDGSFVIICTECMLKVEDGLAPTRMPKDSLIAFFNRRVMKR